MGKKRSNADKEVPTLEEKEALFSYTEFLYTLMPGRYYRDLYRLDNLTRLHESNLFRLTNTSNFPFPLKAVRVPPKIKQIEFLRLLYGSGCHEPHLKSEGDLRAGIKSHFNLPITIIVFNAEYLHKDLIGEIRFLSETMNFSFLLVSIRPLSKDDDEEGDIDLFEDIDLSFDGDTLIDGHEAFQRLVVELYSSATAIIDLLRQLSEAEDNPDSKWAVYELWLAEIRTRSDQNSGEEKLEIYGEFRTDSY